MVFNEPGKKYDGKDFLLSWVDLSVVFFFEINKAYPKGSRE